MDLGNTNIEASGSYTYARSEPHRPAPASGSYSVDQQFESTGWAISALPMLPLGNSWNFFGRLGYYMGDNESTEASRRKTPGPARPSDPPISQKLSESDCSGMFLWGAGVSYTWNQRVSFRLEYDNIKDVAELGNDKTDVERFTLGVGTGSGHRGADGARGRPRGSRCCSA